MADPDHRRGVPAKREDILIKDLRAPDAEFTPLIYGIENRFSLIDTGTDTFLIKTDMGAPKGQILRADLNTPPQQWQTIVPENDNVIEDTSVLGGKLFVDRLVDVKDEISIYTLDGRPQGKVKLPGIGSATVPYGRPLDKEGFYSFDSFNVPPTIYRYQADTGTTSIFAQPKVPFHPERYEVQQVFLTSKDGTRIPMFIAGKKGLARNGKTPLLMTGYGGFNVSITPAWNPMYAWWLEQGGWFAVPNLRGGGEYGEDWHKAGMFEKKQNVFDDFFAATHYLIDQKYTEPGELRDLGALQWRPADGRGHDAASGAVRRDRLRLSAAGHAALSELRVRAAMDNRIRLGGQRGGLQISPRLLAVSEREAGHKISGDHVLLRRQRHPRRPAARAQDDR